MAGKWTELMGRIDWLAESGPEPYRTELRSRELDVALIPFLNERLLFQGECRINGLRLSLSKLSSFTGPSHF
jgi:hypothetical protein